METLRKYGRIYAMFLRNSLIRDMTFKANFVLWIITEVFWFVGQLVFLEVLFLHTERIADWSKWEVVVLIGTHQIITQIFQALFYMNLTNLPELVRTGKLDTFLLLPVDSQFAVSTRQLGLDNVVTTFVGVAIVALAAFKLGLTPTPLALLLYSGAVVLGVAVHYSIMFALASLSFWIVRTQGLIYGYYSLVSLSRYPQSVYRGAFGFIFTWIIPVILVANVPARLLTRPLEAPWPGLWKLALVACLALAGSRLLWRAALRQYGSASS
ncbi:MAG: ABC-2 family transporter protein [Verrucomicrobia bacterium]|nr:ABC-2 family transporter protein [Verrucomicrobiota bacterium]